MARYAIISGNRVENVIVWDGVSDWGNPYPNTLLLNVDAYACGPGDIYDPNIDPPFTRPPEDTRKVYTSYEFLLRFTSDERALIRSTALTDPQTADFLQLAQAAQEIANDDPMTVQGMNYITNIGIITEQRKNEILS